MAVEAVNARGSEENLNLNQTLLSYARYLRFNDGIKPKFSWLGSKDELSSCICLLFDNAPNDNNINIDWSEDMAHHMLSFKAFELTFKLYLTTKTLVIQGKQELEAKEKLFALIQRAKSGTTQGDAEGEDEVVKTTEEEASDVKTATPSDDSVIEIAEHLIQSNIVDTLVNDMTIIKRNYEDLKCQVSALMSDVNTVPTAEGAQSSTQINNMTKEISMMRNQIDELMTKNTILNQKNKDLEAEKASLLTTIRLLNGESERPLPQAKENSLLVSANNDTNKPPQDDFTKAQKKRNRRKKAKQDENKQVPPPTTGNQTEKKQQSTTKTTTVILGDSITKRLNSHRMSQVTQSKVVVRSFPGARVRDMYHYMQPALKEVTKPCHVILHLGTNDLQDKTPEAVADEVQDLARFIEGKYSDTTVSISELTLRKDSEVLHKKVSQTNKSISRYCTQAARGIVKHNNIDQSSLNNYKLHLNNKGVAILASNFTNHITNNH